MGKRHSKRAVILFGIFLAFMAVYYGLRLFIITPWYDELYTYYYFISRGPLYSAIHWPLPNNHVGYSVLSSILNLTGNSYIALRGVSYSAALLNIWLLFEILTDAFSERTAFVSVILYAGLGSVSLLAVQGRGYTLSILCMLIMIREMQHILSENAGNKNYLIMGAAAVYGLYTVPSSLYWVLPMFIAGGILLTAGRKYRKLMRFVISAVISACAVLILYSVIWLAVGSNLLVRNEKSIYFGKTHIQVLKNAFGKAWKTGLDYMLASPYIQSLPAKGFTGRFGDWFLQEMTEMSGYGGLVTAVIVAASAAVLSVMVYRIKKDAVSLVYIVDICFAGSCLMMAVQHKLPYYRVFSFWGVLIAVYFAGMIEIISETCHTGWVLNLLYLFIVAAAVVFLGRNIQITRSQYGERETMAADALRKTYNSSYSEPAVTDCETQYLMKFMYGTECSNTDVDGCDYVIFDRDMVKGSKTRWEYLTDHGSVDWDYVDNTMKEIYGNSDFVVYAVDK